MKVYVKDTKKFQKTILLKGHSLRSLAKKAGLSSGYMSQLASGKRNPSGKVARSIVDVLECDFEDIFFINDDYNSGQKEA